MLLEKPDLNVFLHILDTEEVPSHDTDDNEADEAICDNAGTVKVVLEHTLNKLD